MNALIGAIAGLLLAICSWLAAGWFIARYRSAGDADDGWLTTSALRSLPALLTLAAAAAWGAYACRDGLDLAHAAALAVATILLLTITLVDMAVRRIPNSLLLLLLFLLFCQQYFSTALHQQLSIHHLLLCRGQ